MEDILKRYAQIPNLGGGGMAVESTVIWDSLLRHQLSTKLHGHMAEIGVLRGLGACLMASYLRPDERLILIDPMADEKHWMSAIEHMAPEVTGRIDYFRSDSMYLAKNRNAMLGTRFIHIDGEHSYDAVANDLQTAVDAMHPHALVVVDDFFSDASPAITEAVFDFINRRPSKLSLFLIGFGKAYLCMNRYLGFYRDAMVKLPDDLAQRGHIVQLAAGGMSWERTYAGIGWRRGKAKYQLVGRFTDDPAEFLNLIDRRGV